jgi:hypothetical protein
LKQKQLAASRVVITHSGLYAKAGETDQVLERLELAANIAAEGEKIGDAQDSLDCSSVLGEIAVIFLEAGMRQEALRVAGMIQNEYVRNRTLKSL